MESESMSHKEYSYRRRFFNVQLVYLLVSNMAGLSARNQIQKEELLSAPHWLCFERAIYYTESYKQTEGQHPSVRAAAALEKTFANMTINISPHEMLVGNRSSRLIAPPFAPERGDFTFLFKYRMPELIEFGYHVTEEDKRILFEEIIPYWQGKTVRELKVQKFAEHGLGSQLNFSRREFSRKMKAFGLGKILGLVLSTDGQSSTSKKLMGFFKLLFNLPRYLGALKAGTQDNVIGRGRCIDTQAHIVVGHKNVLKYGFRGLAEKAAKGLQQASEADEKHFLEGVIRVCNAMRDFSARFSALAKRQAESETDEKRRTELLEIARICEKVPWNPPETFYEALQSLWFTQNAIIISYGAGSGITPGRVDQHLFPFYLADVKAGKITPAEALSLIEEFIIKINNNVVIWPNIGGVNLNHLGSDVEDITIGGVDRAGNDATNELSYLFIEAVKNTKLATTVSFRISKKTPDEFLRRIFELHRHTNGPAFFNDEIAVKTLVNDGYSLQAAREYSLVGCVEPSGNGDTFGATGGTKIYLPSVLDLVFSRGKTTFFGNQDTLDAGDPETFKSFDEFMAAYYKQMNELVTKVAEATNLRDEIWATRFNNPLLSSTIDGCIDNAKDMTTGGATYNFGAVGAGGLATTVDSLAAVKKFVYDEKSISMKELIEALQTNFKGKEALRQRLCNGPKFGNDDASVDAIAVDIVDRFCTACRNQKTITGGHFKASFISYGLNIYEGALEPATPDGRRATEPLSNSISPSNGAEKNGPTAALNSVAKIDHTKIGFGNSLNMKFPRALLESEKGLESMKDLVLTYFEKGGFHVQFNVIDAETLKDAQIHPENYADLIVRVSGYSAYFTRLGKDIQDDIIDRTVFTCI